MDADRFGIQDGDVLRIVSQWGEASLPARRDTRVQQGQVFCTFHTPEAHVNRLLGPYRDNKVNTPAYKRTAVRLEKIEGAHMDVDVLNARRQSASAPKPRKNGAAKPRSNGVAKG